jgi:hypothetical protein
LSKHLHERIGSVSTTLPVLNDPQLMYIGKAKLIIVFPEFANPEPEA